jgi:magnesium-transporting ATPase (P-type)
LVNAARTFGITYLGANDEQVLTLVDSSGNIKHFTLLQTLEFDSNRKRMSVILRDRQTHSLKLLCKGADEVIKPRVISSDGKLLDLDRHLHQFSSEGLRTLVVAERALEEKDYEAWREEYERACQAINSRDEAKTRAAEMIEMGLLLLGVTGIEDSL